MTAETVVPRSSASALSTSTSLVGIREATADVQVEATVLLVFVMIHLARFACTGTPVYLGMAKSVRLAILRSPPGSPLYLAVPCGLGQRVYRSSTTLAV